MQKLSRKSQIVVVLFSASAITAGLLLFAYRASLQRAKSDGYQSMHGWQAISGRWTDNAGVFSNSNYGRGDMLIAPNSQGTNYSIGADIRFDLLFPETHYGDAGLVLRTTDPQQGVDSYEGYYAGLRPDEGAVVLGRASYDWHQLAVAQLESPISTGSWNRLELSALGCVLIVTVTPENGSRPTRLQYEDKACMTSGVAGLRSFYAQASWRNVKISSR
jgi:hypothetical protein